MASGDRDSGDGWGGRLRGVQRSAVDDDGAFPHQVTLTVDVPPLTLPRREVTGAGAEPEAAETPPPRSAHEAAHADGWTADRLKRSSLPPSAPPVARPRTKPQVRALDVDHEHGDDALALVGRVSAGTAPALDLVSEMAERFALGDFSGSLRAAELVLGQEPDHALAVHYASESRNKLERLFTSRLAAHGRVPQVRVAESEIRWLGLDPQVSFLLSRVDGVSDYEAVVEASGMPRLAALRALVELVDAKVIRLV